MQVKGGEIEVNLEDFDKALEKIFIDFIKTSYDKRQVAIQAGAEVMVRRLEQASPRDTGKFASSWKIKTKPKIYPNVRFIGNSRRADTVVRRKTKNGTKGEARSNVPLVNILEYAVNSPYYGFVRRTVQEARAEVFQSIKNKLN